MFTNIRGYNKILKSLPIWVKRADENEHLLISMYSINCIIRVCSTFVIRHYKRIIIICINKCACCPTYVCKIGSMRTVIVQRKIFNCKKYVVVVYRICSNDNNIKYLS